MAKFMPERAYATAVLTDFPGIDRAHLSDGGSAAADLCNFRPNSDGSIRKRCGYDHVLSLPAAPRAVYTGYFEGEEVLYFLVGNSLYRRDPDDEYGYDFCGTVEREEGEAAFAVYRGSLFLFDGGEIYVKGDLYFDRVEGYIPLYGKDWDPYEGGEVYEAENRLTSRIRIRYQNREGRNTLYFDRRVLSVNRVVLDGREDSTFSIELLASGMGCTSPLFSTATVIELTLTPDCDNEREAIAACTRLFVYGDAQDRRLVAWRGTDRSVLYGSQPVSDEAIEASGTDGSCLYFPHGASLYRVDAPVTAVSGYFERLLVFTASGAWAADSTDRSWRQVSASVGCDKEGAAALCGNTTVTYFAGKLWSWKAKSDARNEFTATELSLPVAEIVSAMRPKAVSLVYYGARQELWISAAGDEHGSVLIYHTGLDRFYRFDGVFAEQMLGSMGEARFLYGMFLFEFREDCCSDYNGREITATYRGGWFDFGHPERTKHIVRCFSECDPNGGTVTVRLFSERGCGYATDLSGSAEEVPPTYGFRAPIGRFRYLSFSLTARGMARQKIASLSIAVRK